MLRPYDGQGYAFRGSPLDDYDFTCDYYCACTGSSYFGHRGVVRARIMLQISEMTNCVKSHNSCKFVMKIDRQEAKVVFQNTGKNVNVRC